MNLGISPITSTSFKARIVLGSNSSQHKPDFSPKTMLSDADSPINVFIKKILSIFFIKDSGVEKLKSKFKIEVQVKLPS